MSAFVFTMAGIKSIYFHDTFSDIFLEISLYTAIFILYFQKKILQKLHENKLT